jgi:lipoyl synthase
MYPSWLIKKTPKSSNIRKIRELIDDDSIRTVCESAKCPNIGECYSKNTVTFMILGDVCTRNCRFCAVQKGKPGCPDPKEPEKVAQAARKLSLKHVVVTSVTRDDLSDGGASQFAKTIREIRKLCPEAKVEVLIPDLQGNGQNLSIIIAAEPNIINHNLETVPRLYPTVRSLADYKRSLNVLKTAKKSNNSLYIKSGIMVGLGEKQEEVVSLMEDLRGVDCDILTIGQYLRPSKEQVEVSEFIEPEVFEGYRKTGEKMGFKRVFSGPFVRSSYKAGEIYA